MGVDEFREFITLVTYKSYTAAASALNISQPTLSRHIDALEAELAVKLVFDGKPFCMTTAGELVFERASELVASYDALVGEVKPFRKIKPERIVIQDMRHLRNLFVRIDEARRIARDEHPELAFTLASPKASERPVDMLENGINVSFTFTISEDPHHNLDLEEPYRSLALSDFCDELCFGVPKDSDLADRNDLSLKDFEKMKFFSPAQRSHEDFRKDFTNICQEKGFFPHFSLIQTNNLLEFYAMDFKDGVYVLTMPNKQGLKYRYDLFSDNLKLVKISETYYISAFMLYREDRMTDSFNSFIDTMKKLNK